MMGGDVKCAGMAKRGAASAMVDGVNVADRLARGLEILEFFNFDGPFRFVTITLRLAKDMKQAVLWFWLWPELLCADARQRKNAPIVLTFLTATMVLFSHDSSPQGTLLGDSRWFALVSLETVSNIAEPALS